jgi:Fe2+ transport system protein FeoA
VVRVVRDLTGRADRLAALGVTAGAKIRVVQTFPGIVFECDQTELAVERAVARSILVEAEESQK